MTDAEKLAKIREYLQGYLESDVDNSGVVLGMMHAVLDAPSSEPEQKAMLCEVFHGAGCYIIYFDAADMQRDAFEELSGIECDYEESVNCAFMLRPVEDEEIDYAPDPERQVSGNGLDFGAPEETPDAHTP